MKLLLLCCILFTASFSYAQDEIPDFGNFSHEERSLKECDFDKEADAVVLFHSANSNYNDEYNLITTHRIRFKILKEKGIERANIEIPFYSKEDFEFVSHIEAATYTPGDNGDLEIKTLDKKSVFRQKVNDRISLVKFALPNVKTGTIVDYSYEITAKTFGGLDDWYFQSDMPTVLSRYYLTILPRAEFRYLVHKSPAMQVKVNPDKTNGSILFQMNNIPGLRYEPFMDARKDYLQYVEFQLAGYLNSFGSKQNFMTTWKESANELMGASYFGKQLDKNLANSEEIILKVSNYSEAYDKMKLIYNYVRNNFSWNKVDSKFADDGLKNVWANKKGTSGEINLVLINLLKQAGLQVSPVLVSERDHGKITTDYPILDQFNKVVACVNIDGRKFFLDATSVNTPPDIIPFEILNTNAFVVNNKKPEIISLSDKRGATNFVNLYADIEDNGTVSGFANISSYYYARVNRLSDYMKNKEDFRRDYFEKNYTEMRIDSFQVNNIENDSLPLTQQFKFYMSATVSGDYKLVNVNLFSGLEKNLFTSDNRLTDIDFGCTRRTDINATFQLPPDMRLEEKPKNVQLVTPDKSISFMRLSEVNDNSVIIQISLKIDQTLYTTDSYPVIKEFYKKMYDLLNEQIVLAKK